MRIALILVICCGVPSWVSAQPVPPTLPRNDATITVGWAGSEYDLSRYDSWRQSLLVGTSAGHYWTDHLKTEIEVGWSNPGKAEIYEDITYSGALTYAVVDHRSHDIRLGATQIYQFGRNAWVHPYVGVGFDVVRRDIRIDRGRQSRVVVFAPNQSVPVEIPAASEHRTEVFGQGILKTGLKLYATEKAFFNTELKLGIRRNIDHVVWRIGLGFDF